jgi:hypothetical protein
MVAEALFRHLVWLGIATWATLSVRCAASDGPSPASALEFIAPLSDEDFDGSRLRFEVAVTGAVPAEVSFRYFVWSDGQLNALELGRSDEAFGVRADWLWCSLSGRKTLMIAADVLAPYASRSQEEYGLRRLAAAYVEYPLSRVFASIVPDNVECGELTSSNRATTLSSRQLTLELDAPPFGRQELVNALAFTGRRLPSPTLETPSGMANGCTVMIWKGFEYSESKWDARNKVLACRVAVAAIFTSTQPLGILTALRLTLASHLEAAGCRLAFIYAGSKNRARPSAAATNTPTSSMRTSCI